MGILNTILKKAEDIANSVETKKVNLANDEDYKEVVETLAELRTNVVNFGATVKDTFNSFMGEVITSDFTQDVVNTLDNLAADVMRKHSELKSKYEDNTSVCVDLDFDNEGEDEAPAHVKTVEDIVDEYLEEVVSPALKTYYGTGDAYKETLNSAREEYLRFAKWVLNR